MIIKDPLKRTDLSILKDDPWLLEGMTEEEIEKIFGFGRSSRMSRIIDLEDDGILNIIEKKFKFPKESVRQALQENIYDERTAIYYLLYDERDKKLEEMQQKQQQDSKSSSAGGSRSGSPIPKSDMPKDIFDELMASGRASPIPSYKNQQASYLSSNEPKENVSPSISQSNSSNRLMNIIIEEDGASQKTATLPLPQSPKQSSLYQSSIEQAPQSSPSMPTRITINNNSAGGQTSKISPPTSAPAAAQASAISMAIGKGGRRRRFTIGAGEENNPTVLEQKSQSPANGSDGKPVEAATPNNQQQQQQHNEANADSSATKPATRSRRSTLTSIFRTMIKGPEEASTQVAPAQTTAVKASVPLASSTSPENSATDNAAVTNNIVAKPRPLRFTFNSRTTSNKAPQDLIASIKNVANSMKWETSIISTGKFIFELTCKYSGVNAKKDKDDGDDTVRFEVEICKLPRMNNLHGLKLRRILGTTGQYKEVCDEFLSKIVL